MIDPNLHDRLTRAAHAYRRGDLSRREFQAIVLAILGVLKDAEIALEVLQPGEIAEVVQHTTDLLANRPLISVGSTPHLHPENEDAGAHAFNILVQRGTEAFRGLDFLQAATNVHTDAKGDWFQDPWGLPEVTWLAKRGHHVLDATLIAADPPVYGTPANVPKSAHTERPATILDPLGRLVYQAIVDAASARLTSDLPTWTFGWRVPAGSNNPGEYAHNNFQWQNYVRRIGWDADINPNALRTDIEDFFASINTDHAIPALFSHGPHASYLTRLINTWNEQTNRQGLPQRCLASSVIANGFLANVDNTVSDEWHPSSRPVKGNISAVRWMDDFWIFSPASLSRPEIERPVREAIAMLGLTLNEAKTNWFEGESLQHEVDAVNFSYEIEALESEPPDFEPLIERARSLLQESSSLEPREVRFLAKTALNHDVDEILDLLVEHLDRLVAGIDQVCRTLRETGRWSELEDWFVLTLRSSQGPWIKSSLFQLLPKETVVNSNVLEAIKEAAEQDENYTVMSNALNYLSYWDPSTATEIIRARIRNCVGPELCRSMALAGVRANMEKPEITRMLDMFPQCFATLEMLRDMDFRLPNGGSGQHSS